mmetsp:Transcript_14233/g.39200  ORF Transcript_14233/g.39200 Transcript_14233/m.39200 type:complete len:80 (+) Transcript_14233:901-1140(+)
MGSKDIPHCGATAASTAMDLCDLRMENGVSRWRVVVAVISMVIIIATMTWTGTISDTVVCQCHRAQQSGDDGEQTRGKR